MSYGAAQECFAESAELQRATAAGVLLVAAAGNEFAEGNPLEYPASLPHVVTVAAVDLSGQTSYFSNANAAVDLAAPGERIATAVPIAHDPDGDGNGYALLDGTSFAAPIVAGVAAWVAAERPNLTVDQLANVVKLSAIDLDEDGWDPNTGYGLVQVGNALRVRAPRNDPHEPNENIFWVNGEIFRNPDPRVYDGRPRRGARQGARRPVRGSGGRLPRPLPRPLAHADHRQCRATATPTWRSTAAARTARRPRPVGLSQRAGRSARAARDREPEAGGAAASSRSTSTRRRAGSTRATRSSSSGFADARADAHRLHVDVLERARAVVRAQPGGRVARDQAAVADQRDLLAQRLGLVEVVGRQQDRRALRVQPADVAPQLGAQLEVDARRWARRGSRAAGGA